MDQQALEAREKVLGIEHPHMLTRITNLDLAFWMLG